MLEEVSENYSDVLKPETYECLAFDNPIDFAYYFHPALKKWSTFHDWQEWALTLCTLETWNKSTPLELYLVASNGSGKDSYFIAILALFLLTCKKRNLVVVTTKDGKQLYNQTYPYMASFAEAINKQLKQTGVCTKDFIDIKFGKLSSSKTGGVVLAFVTDEAGRAEGYHPFPDEEESELTLIINEAKSVEPQIFQAFRRCNPYTRYLCVSSTGTDSGYFYEHATKATTVTYPAKVNPKKPYCRYITSYDCPHVSPELIARDKEELEDWLFGSIHESRFSSLEGNFAIPSYIVAKNKFAESEQDLEDYAVGIDLSLGGDETAGVARKGPRVIGEEYFRDKSSKIVKETLLGWIGSLDLPDDTNIFVDVGGIGNPILQDLRDICDKYNWIGVANQSAARRANFYLNTGAEDYFHVRSLLEKNRIPTPSDVKTLEQLTKRRFEKRAQKYKLETKEDAKSRGEKSPDRADAYVLCFRRYRIVFEKNDTTPEERILLSKNDPNVVEKLKAFIEKQAEVLNKPKYVGRSGGFNSVMKAIYNR